MALPKVQVIPGWERNFLRAIKNGYSEQTAANAVGVGTAAIHRRLETDSNFKGRYDEAYAGRRERPTGGLF